MEKIINGAENVKIDVLIKMFNKYGFHSLKKEPYIYKNNDEIGISFTFDDPLYGELTRIFIPKTAEEAEDFLGKYSWFKKHGKKYNISISLSDYKLQNPEIKFTKEKKEYSLEELKILSNNDLIQKNSTKKEFNYLKKLKRTLFLLISIINEKKKIEIDIYNNLNSLIESYNDKKEELELKTKKLNKNYVINIINCNESKKSFLFQQDFTNQKNLLLKNNTKEKLEEEIDNLVTLLETAETNENLISNKYELIKLPLMIEEINQKLKIVDDALNKKKKLFAKKERIDLQFAKIDDNSVINQMVNFENYENNEINRIKEKYAMIPELDKRTIADFLIEFDNLNIKDPSLEELMLNDSKEISYEDIMLELEKSFNQKKEEEKNILIIYHSILKFLIFNDQIISDKEVKEFINLINSPSNIMLKIKYFKNLDTSSTTNFLNSLIKEASKISNINCDLLEGSINVFFKDKKLITAEKFIQASNKRALAPVQTKDENDVNYIALLKPKTAVYFIPEEIAYDFANDDSLIKKSNQPFFLIDLQKNSIKNSKSDILKIVRYENVLKKENDICLVTELKSQKVDQYKNIVIEGNEKNE